VVCAGVAIRAGTALGVFRVPEYAGFSHITQAAVPGAAGAAATLLSLLFVMNVLLGTFNLLPFPPLDGHTGITLLMSPARAVRYLDWARELQLGMAGAVLAWVVYAKFFSTIFRLFLAALYPGSHWG